MKLSKLFTAEPGASFSRFASFIALMFSCAWVTHLVWHNNALPDLGGITLFVSAVYGMGKAADLYARVKNGNGNGGAPPPVTPPAAQ